MTLRLDDDMNVLHFDSKIFSPWLWDTDASWSCGTTVMVWRMEPTLILSLTEPAEPILVATNMLTVLPMRMIMSTWMRRYLLTGRFYLFETLRMVEILRQTDERMNKNGFCNWKMFISILVLQLYMQRIYIWLRWRIWICGSKLFHNYLLLYFQSFLLWDFDLHIFSKMPSINL